MRAASEGSFSERLEEANAAYRAATRPLLERHDAFELIRDEMRAGKSSPFLLVLSHPYPRRVELLPELVHTACSGRPVPMALATDLIRTLPKSAVEQLIVSDLERLVEGMTVDEVEQLVSVVIELGLPSAIERIRSYARHGSDDMQSLADRIDGVELDPAAWRLSRKERRGQRPQAD